MLIGVGNCNRNSRLDITMKYFMIQFANAILNKKDVPVPGPITEAGILSNVLNAVYFWAGILAVGLIIYGGFIYTISNGDPSKVKKAKDSILYAVIGLVVVLLAFAITSFVVKGVNTGA